ncbi:MAG: hypothetical protein M1833_006955 [Piccolia ochrophora]|nr:MAG: hypothetical protein M1833_006955 [Piccolia ochrophora]
MTLFWLLVPVLFVLLSFFAYLAVSSCLGDDFRARSHNALFDRSYLRTWTSSGPATWEQIELDEMLNDSPDEEEE